MKYYFVKNTGKGFITHAENESSHISGYPGDVWVTENTTWASRVGAISKTKEEAQSLVDTFLKDKVYPKNHKNAGDQIIFVLP
jgi:hypothetical protein